MRKTQTALIICLLSFSSRSFAQEESFPPGIRNFDPDAKAVGFGGSLVVQARDPLAIFWNPALLSGLKDRAVLFTINEPFEFSLANLTQFVPLYGTFGVSFSRIPTPGGPLDRGTFGWGRSLSDWFAIGSNLSFQRLDSRWFAVANLGLFVGNARIGTLDERWRKHKDLKMLDRLSLGITIQELPLSERIFDTAGLLGMSYLFPSLGLLLNSGYHIRKGDNTGHLGIGVEITNHVMANLGIENLDSDRFGFGASYSRDNFLVNLSYSVQQKKLFITFSARMSPSPESIALPYYKKGAESWKKGDYKSANRSLKKYLSFDLFNGKADSARTLIGSMESQLVEIRFRVDSLFKIVNKYLRLGKPQLIRAAWFLNRILELDPDNVYARANLAKLQPDVDEFVKKSLGDGVLQHQAKNYLEAKKLFNRALAFVPEHPEALKYISKIREELIELSEKHFHQGVGFFVQKNYFMARRQLEKALEFNPESSEALSYLNRTNNKIQRIVTDIEQRLNSGRALEKQGKYIAATNEYSKILKLDPNNKFAKVRIEALGPYRDKFVENRYSRGMRYLREENFAKAEEAFTTVLSIDAGHRAAKNGLARLRDSRSKKAAAYLKQADQAYAQANWQIALDYYGKVLNIETANQKAKQGKAAVRKQVKIDRLLMDGRQAMADHQILTAIDFFEEAVATNSNHREAQKELNDANKAKEDLIEKLFNQGINLFTLDRYQEAIEKWNEVLKLDSKYRGAIDYKQQAQQRIKALKKLKQ